jgi:ParB/RepB/Spo0J family partition protein
MSRTNARPGGAPADEPKRIENLVSSLRATGQIMPLVVDRGGADEWFVVAGARRLAAARTIDPDYMLDCIVRKEGTDALQVAIHENTRRRGYNPLQYAYLIAAVRAEKGFTGTKEIAAYIGCSRAQIQQHERLLSKPDGMNDTDYAALLADLTGKNLRADAAFYALTHVEPARTGEVLERAAEIAQSETVSKAPRGKRQAVTHAEPSATSPASQESQQSASEREAEPAKTAPETSTVQKRHVERAAKETRAVRKDAPKARGRAAVSQAAGAGVTRTLPELRKLFDTLRGTSYPDPMRAFISKVNCWWSGDCTDKEVVQQWSQLSILVEDGLKWNGVQRATAPAKKAAKRLS